MTDDQRHRRRIMVERELEPPYSDDWIEDDGEPLRERERRWFADAMEASVCKGCLEHWLCCGCE